MTNWASGTQTGGWVEDVPNLLRKSDETLRFVPG